MLPVIACLDGTEKDSRAVAVATAVATLADADLHLIRIIDVPSERWVGQAMAVDSADDVAAVRRDAAAQLSDVIAGISLQTARRASFEVLEASDIAAAIIEHALQREARVVVMATRAAGAVGRATVGSVADRVVRESPRPVVVVPPGAEYLGGKTVQFGRVLVPQDGSSLAFRALEFLIELPHASELEFVLIEVVSREHDCMAAETRLKNSAAWLRSRGVTIVETVVAEGSNAAAAITGAVRELLPDIIAMSTRGASGLSRVVLGSVAEGVVRTSELPVLLLTPKVLTS